ncbi:MAG: ATP-binding protein [Phycisphaerales bacterium]
MPLLEALQEKLSDALLPSASAALTRRDATLPPVPGKAHAVIGMRRAGKTCFLRQLLAQRREHGPPERSIYLSFDDDRLAGIDATQLDALLEEYFRRHPEIRRRGRAAWFLDEIQLVDGWDRFVRRVLDTESIDIVVSGSSARMFSREIHSSLRGRAMATVIAPFSFREALRHRGEEPSVRADRLPAAARSAVEKRLREYLVIGGFPEAQGAGRRPLDRATRIALLQGYVDTVLFRDVIERHAVSQVAALRWIIRHALRNPCGSFSAGRLHADLRSQGHSVAKDTVHALLDYLTDAFVIAAIPVATESERRRNTNPRKLYPADPGLIDAFDASGRANTGHALETAVFNELARRGAEIAYVKTADGLEVDFLARHPDGRQELIQVCADASDAATWQRETRALDAAHAEHPRAERIVVVLDTVAARGLSHPKTRVLPAHQWLLAAE